MSSSYSTRNNPLPPECFKKLENLCNLCGQFVFKKSFKVISESIRTSYFDCYGQEMLADGIRSPDKICSSCRISICSNDRPLRFVSPMNWRLQRTITMANHDETNCYCCLLPNVFGHSSSTKNKLLFPYHVTTIVPPHPLPANRQVNNSPEPMDVDANVAPAEPNLTVNEPGPSFSSSLPPASSSVLSDETTSTPTATNSSESEQVVWDYQQRMGVPQKVTTADLRVLFLSLNNSSIRNELKILRFLKKKSLLEKEVKIKDFITGHNVYSSFYSEKAFDGGSYVYCNDIELLLFSLDYPPADQWRIWIDNARITQRHQRENSFKVALLHIGNKFKPVPLLYSNTLGETYEHLKEVLDVLEYEQFQWPICVDLKIASILVGRSGGNPLHPCHLCKWNRNDNPYSADKIDCSNLARTRYIGTHEQVPHRFNFSIQNNSLISDPTKILMPPLHIRLGIFQKLFEKLNARARNYLLEKFNKPDEQRLVFNGPEIATICRDNEFETLLKSKELAAFNAFRNVSYYVLSSANHPLLERETLVDTFFETYKNLGCNFTHKMHLLRSHLDLFPDDIDDYSDQHGEHFHQQLQNFERNYISASKSSMLGRWCFYIANPSPSQ